LRYGKKSIEKRPTEEWIVNEVVSDSIDVGINHQRVNKAKDQHDPKRRVRVEKEEREKINEVEQAGECRNDIPSGVCEKFRVGFGAFDYDGIGGHVSETQGRAATILMEDIRFRRKFCEGIGDGPAQRN
jgi:hypothetical protein